MDDHATLLLQTGIQGCGYAMRPSSDRAAAAVDKGKSMHISAARAGCLAVAAFISLPSLADTVTLDNGDRLTGTITRLDSGKSRQIAGTAGNTVGRHCAMAVLIACGNAATPQTTAVPCNSKGSTRFPNP